MSSDTDIERLVEALQQDGPSDRDVARLRARLAGAGIATGLGLAQGTAGASVPAAKAAASVGVGLSTRWAAISLLPKMGIVTTVVATAIGGPLVAVELRHRTVAEPASVATRAQDGARADARRVAEPAPERAEPPRVDAIRAASEDQPRAANGAERAVRSARAPRVVAAERAPEASEHVTPNVEAAPVLAATTTTDLVASSEDATARFTENQPSSPPPRASSLAEETALIDAAFAALRAEDAATAAALVAEHARRFPRGLLWRERERARQKLATPPGSPRRGTAPVAPGG